MTPSCRLLVLWTAAAAVLAGCGGDDDDVDADGDADADVDADADADTDADADCDPAESPPPPAGTCAAPVARRIEAADDLPEDSTGDSIAGLGDWLLQNDRVRIYIDDVDNPNGIALSGGTVIDVLPAGQLVDHFGQLTSIFFLEQGNFLAYDEIEAGTEEGAAFVVARGTVRGGPQGDFSGRLEVVTRYELRACETALRIWTDVTNVSDEIIGGGLGTVTTDLLLWGPRGMQPFCPGQAGQGYACPGFDPSNPLLSVASFPFIGAAASFAGPFSLALVTLDPAMPTVFGVNDDQVSGVGASDALGAALSPGDTRRYGRALLVATDRNDVASASDLAFRGQARCGGPPTGSVCLDLDLESPFPAGDAHDGGVLFYRSGAANPHDAATRVPLTHARATADGEVRVTLPEGTVYFEIAAPGGMLDHGGPIEAFAGVDAPCVPTTVSTAAHLSIELVDAAGKPLAGRVIVKGTEGTADPFFGPARGGSPSVNTALVGTNGLVDVWAPPGRYHVYATHGIEWSMAEQEITLEPSGLSLTFELEPLIETVGMLAADMHVHSVLSWDSSLPLEDRVLAYVAEGMDVIVSTEHDVVGDYAPTITALGLEGVIATIPGLESTGTVVTSELPHTVGHHNAWPITLDPNAPRNGAPLDEGSAIPELYERLRAVGAEVVQLNHGRASTVGDVWLGWLDSCGFDPLRPAADFPDCWLGQWDVMEVMNGSAVATNLLHRNDWFSLLSQLPFIPGTANSDSHRLVLEEAGYPRNYVIMSDDLGAFDRAQFSAAVKAGRMIGTNGPILEVTAYGADAGVLAGPGQLLEVAADQPVTLALRVQAVPWIPVEQVVVYANAVPIMVLAAELDDASVVRFDEPLDLGALGEDSWIVVEAGTPWPAAGEDPPASPEPLGSIAPGTVPHAFSNPIFVSVDADGEFDRPGL